MDDDLPSRRTALTLYVLLLVSAWPLGAVIAATSPKPADVCSGIGFGCSLYGWDLAVFLLGYLGIPYALVVGLVVAGLVAIGGRGATAGAVVAGGAIVVPWLFVATMFASPQ